MNTPKRIANRIGTDHQGIHVASAPLVFPGRSFHGRGCPCSNMISGFTKLIKNPPNKEPIMSLFPTANSPVIIPIPSKNRSKEATIESMVHSLIVWLDIID